MPVTPAEFSLMPFWFWNDALDAAELLRQIDDFASHGVHGFIIHPRVGLPRDCGFMSERLLGFMRIAIEEAAWRGMKVVLYDEGMYPSGSASGLVVAADPSLACRCLALHDELPLEGNIVGEIVRDGRRKWIIDRRVDSVIRGLHYLDEDAATEDAPPAGDILNPRTSAAVLRIVYGVFYERFREHFGSTILGVFTDEPGPLGRPREKNVHPYTTGLLREISDRLGYDFTPHLPALWFDDEPEATRHRANYKWAVNRRLDESWYTPLSAWCAARGVALCGHPDRGDEIGVQRFFQAPGQDLVWRWVLPDHPSALEGPESTQAKCSSSAMIHGKKRRNSNEFCGAYGHETTFAEFKWLADWCLIRGVNWLMPHAFYYSTRGPRSDERPPQVGGVGCKWWGEFKPFADHAAMLCALNTDARHVCDIAVLADPDHCPWPAAKELFQNQRDFNYLDTRTFEEDAILDAAGLTIAGITYRALVLDGEYRLTDAARKKLKKLGSRVVARDAGLLDNIDLLAARSLTIDSLVPALRIRQVEKDGVHWVMFFNEGRHALSTTFTLADRFVVADSPSWIDSATGQSSPAGERFRVDLAGYATALLRVPLADAK